MKPEANSRRLFGITRAKGKMYEFGLPEDSHITIPQDQVPEELLILTIATLGDAAARVSDTLYGDVVELDGDLRFSASFFDALFSSGLAEKVNRYLVLLASAAYLLEERPGSSLVMAKLLDEHGGDSSLFVMMRWILQGDWSYYYTSLTGPYGQVLCSISEHLARHFLDGTGAKEVSEQATRLRQIVYHSGDAEDILLCDLISAVAITRIKTSVWTNLPGFSQLDPGLWSTAIQKEGFPTELWPSQLRLGQTGVFAGASGVVQMPTSAGKTRSVEIIIRSAFLSKRTNTAVVIAPFRALCHEIKQSLAASFIGEDVRVDELTDSFQSDYMSEFEELFGIRIERPPSVVVMTPEKFLYVLRQDDSIVEGIGLVVYDEGHQFDSGYRGVTYELLLTEIKRLLRPEAQTVLISAVVQNAEDIGLWLIGDEVKIVEGADLLPTTRATAFASWAERLGQVMFYEGEVSPRSDYFVPRVIEQQRLGLFGSETAERFFPVHDDTVDVSLYLGLRLVSQGPVAIFCGKKSSAERVIKRAAEIFERGVNLAQPSQHSDRAEVEKLKSLFALHFGENSTHYQAAALGVFAHHGNTPHGLRLSIEYAMQQSLIRFVACTSTLAQGVNLPIRYLVVSGVYQGADKIKVRDFHNLMGRAGRSGMHTEGLVIFADPRIYDQRLANSWKFDIARELLDPHNTEPTTSSLLSLVKPLVGRLGASILFPLDQLIGALLSESGLVDEWIVFFVQTYQAYRLNADAVGKELKYRRSLIQAIESFLMSHRGDMPYVEFQQQLVTLVHETLAFSLADDTERQALTSLFLAVAERVEGMIPDVERQAAFGKTLLGALQAVQIEAWVNANRGQLLDLDANEELLEMVWDILREQLGNKFSITTLPEELPKSIARMWINGCSYHAILDHVRQMGGTKPWGNSRRRLSEEDVIGFCEGGLGFDFPLGVAAISQFLFTSDQLQEAESAPIRLFQKALKYGVPNALAVSAYEYGIADRMLAIGMARRLVETGYQEDYFVGAVANYRQIIDEFLEAYPSYYDFVMKSG